MTKKLVGYSRNCLMAIAAMVAILPRPAAAQALGSYNIDPAQVSVSGISSGGYMANQVHVAFSKTIMGAGIVAGGPFSCARTGMFDYTTTATHVCTGVIPPRMGDPDSAQVAELTRDASNNKTIDDVSNLCKARVYLFSGLDDTTVPKSVMDTLKTFYDTFSKCKTDGAAEAVQYVGDQHVVHAFVTDDYGPTCDDLAKKPVSERTPYICNGKYDTAQAILTQIYGPLKPKIAAVAANLKTFDQKDFMQHPYSSDTDSLHKVGHIYVPTACADGKTACKLHVSFHGCHQSQDESKDAYYAHTGYNEWAEANNIVVLYPQARALSVTNPEGCWDFWGYNRVDFYQRGGPQLSAIGKMIDKATGKKLVGDKAAGPAN